MAWWAVGILILLCLAMWFVRLVLPFLLKPHPASVLVLRPPKPKSRLELVGTVVGFVAVAFLLAWSLFLLILHPESEERVQFYLFLIPSVSFAITGLIMILLARSRSGWPKR